MGVGLGLANSGGNANFLHQPLVSLHPSQILANLAHLLGKKALILLALCL
jgi:hypothetical protein